MLVSAKFVFWFSLAALIYVYAGYPLLLGLIAIFFPKKQSAQDYFPLISVLVAAYNEEECIGRKIEGTLALDYPSDKMEILVLSDGSTDRTDEIVRAFRDPRVRLLRMEPRRGKTAAQNRGVLEAHGEILIFSDATTAYQPQALRYLVSNYRDSKVGAAGGRFQYFDAEGQSPTGLGTVAFWNYETLIKWFQSRIDSITGCSGCIYSVRKAAYTELPDAVISDLVQPLWVIQKGYRVVFEDRAMAFESTTRSSTEEFSMRVRVVTRGMRGLLSVPEILKPWKFPWISFQLISHKILRWMAPIFLLLLFLSNLLLSRHSWYGTILVLQAAFYLWALVSLSVPLHRKWKVLGIPLYFCVLNAAALCSVIEVARGKQYVVWETVRT